MDKNLKKHFLIIYIGQAFSLLGSSAVQFAIIWWLTLQTESAITLMLASIVSFIPNMLIGPFAGVLVDKYNRKTVMIAADGLVALSSVFLGVMFMFTPSPNIAYIYVILFIRGLGGTFHSPAMQAAIPTLVPPEMLTKVGGWGSLINSISSMLGPVLGAALLSFLSLPSVMLVDILGAIFAIICLLFVKIPSIKKSEEKVYVLRDMKQGFLAMSANKPLMAIFFPMVLVNVLYMPLGTLFPLLVRTHFMGGAWHNSVAEFVFAGGLFLSSVVIGIWGGMKKRFLMVSLATVMLGVVSLVSGMLPSTGFWIFVVCCLFMGATGTFLNVRLWPIFRKR